MPISAEGLRFIAEWIGQEIARKGYAIDEELRSAMRRQMPSVADDIESFTTYGLRNCLAVLLGDQFDFNGRVMSAKGVKVDMSTVISVYGNGFDLNGALSVYLTGLPFSLAFGVATALFLFLFGEAFIKKSTRIIVKYKILS